MRSAWILASYRTAEQGCRGTKAQDSTRVTSSKKILCPTPIQTFIFISPVHPPANPPDSVMPSLKWILSSFQGRLVPVLLQAWGIKHPLILHFPKIKVILLHKRMTAEVLCTDRIRSTPIVPTLLSWQWAAAGTHPAKSAWTKGIIYLPHKLL